MPLPPYDMPTLFGTSSVDIATDTVSTTMDTAIGTTTVATTTDVTTTTTTTSSTTTAGYYE